MTGAIRFLIGRGAGASGAGTTGGSGFGMGRGSIETLTGIDRSRFFDDDRAVGMLESQDGDLRFLSR